MDYYQAFFLSSLQGLTEFLPISSSAHLILMPALLDWPDQGLAFDVAVHVGTLSAVLVYFRRDVRVMVGDWFASWTVQPATVEARLAWYIIIATIPVGLVGISLSDEVELLLRTPLIIAASTLIFGGLLWFAASTGKEIKDKGELTWKDALLIGLFQALALIPGTSRSGITITAGLLLGFKREVSARFSFLLSMPAIALPGMLKTVELIQTSESVFWDILLFGVLVSAVIAYLTIDIFLKLLDRIGLMPFVIYRFMLGLLLIYLFSG
jgi:undecaprenyl-diphosphatase